MSSWTDFRDGAADGWVSFASVGLIDDASDPTGRKKAAADAKEGQTKALAAEERMFDKSMAFQEEQWDWQKKKFAPWEKAGLANLGKYQEELDAGFNFQEEPGYKFRQAEGEKGINRAASAGGRYLSGGTLRELGRYNSNLASAEYSKGYSRYQDRLTRLGQLSTLGYNATTSLGNIGQNYSNTGSNLMTNYGRSESQMYQNIGAINAQSATAGFNTLLDIGNTVSSFYNPGGGGGNTRSTA